MPVEREGPLQPVAAHEGERHTIREAHFLIRELPKEVDGGLAKDGKSVTIQGENRAQATFGGTKVPDGFPSDVPLPKGLKLKTTAGCWAHIAQFRDWIARQDSKP